MATKKIRVGINGFGRIGRLAFREIAKSKDMEVVAINNSGDINGLVHLLKYDSAHGPFMVDKLSAGNDHIKFGDKKVKVFSTRDPKQIPWKSVKVDLVLECTGAFKTNEELSWHIEAGAKKVLLSAPGQGMKTIVYGVNHKELKSTDKVVSAASCTTNCLAPLAQILDKEFGLVKGYMTTVHAYTNDQQILDKGHKDLRRARAAAVNIIPTTTGAASAVGKVLPNLKGKLDGIAIRVPVITGSCVDLVCELKKSVTVDKINKAVQKNAGQHFGYTNDPIVSTDIIGNRNGGVFDALSTMVMEVEGKQMVKLLAWYDNESSYTAQLIRVAKHMMTTK